MARPQVAKTPLAQRLTDVRKALGFAARLPFAQSLEMHPDTLGGYERGDSTPDHEFLSMYKRRFGVNLDWLITGDGPMFTPKEVVQILAAHGDRTVYDPAMGSGGFLMQALEHMTEKNGDETALPAWLQKADFVNLPQYDVRASAGRGLIPINEMPVSQTAFERSFLRSLGGAPDFCFMMWAAGDSMLPTINDNALLIVDSSQNIVDHGRIYVFAVGSGVLVKRAKWRMDGTLELTSDNVDGNYPVETFHADRVEDLTVVGRVIFIGHQS
ncbi:XRE family transcriptional regulator [Agrobacterium tumefaciens]|uniref:XRE family transcriptional regulator n=1 Tax=Agrobacterium tumefaciens TaxID=358 RepID=UPI0021CE0BA9|nr:S24 family peptidase [Agrobacterium tumefaciens]UXT99418.1 N-6 DNA methylase [Agrobacterium tumefaciens]